MMWPCSPAGTRPPIGLPVVACALLQGHQRRRGQAREQVGPRVRLLDMCVARPDASACWRPQAVSSSSLGYSHDTSPLRDAQLRSNPFMSQ